MDSAIYIYSVNMSFVVFLGGVRVADRFSFLCFCLSSSCVLCAQCCQCLWIVYCWLPIL